MSDTSTAASVSAKAKKAIAEHTLIDATGNVVDEMEQAHGIGYKDLASGLSTKFIPTNPDALRMLAVFGAKTLAGNTASQARQKDGGPQDEIDSIEDVFEYMESGKGWRDSTREAGPRWDFDVLAQAALNVLIADGKLPDASKHDAVRAGFVTKLTADAGQAAKMKVVTAANGLNVEAEYRRLKGRVATSTDDLLAMTA